MQKIYSAKATVSLAYLADYYTQQGSAIPVAAISAYMPLPQQQRR